MQILETVAELRAALLPVRKSKKTIGFVPTMGALHEGHLSLVRLAREQSDVVVVSIFVNPTQFAPGEDFEKYPRTPEDDRAMLEGVGVDYLFMPSPSEVYPEGAATTVHVEGPSEGFEGEKRPGHFDGVATVVAALFNMVQPSMAYFGQKDAQQVAVIKQMVRNLHFPVKICVAPIVRSEDGLALSSRNRYLSSEEGRKAPKLYEILDFVKRELQAGKSINHALSLGIEEFRRSLPMETLDYLSIVDSETFRTVTSFDAGNKPGRFSLTIVIAARFGKTRLIDNETVEVDRLVL